jgi:predicted Zn-dependent peptidase
MAVTMDDLRRASREYLRPENLVYAFLGNAEELKPQLDSLGTVHILTRP